MSPALTFNVPCRELWRPAALFCLLLAGCALSRPHYVAPDLKIGDPAFTRAVEAHVRAGLVKGNRAKILANGDEIFPAMLTAIWSARRTITFANFVYENGEIATDMATALAERCRAGVRAHILLDAVGSSHMPKRYKESLRAAGCDLAFYHSLNALALKRVNHRNHRRVLVVDGRAGFTGGTGVGDRWGGDGRRANHWRQTDVYVEGPIVHDLQAAFVENWRDTTGVLLAGDSYFPPLAPRGDVVVQAVKSSPASGAADAYMLFLLAIEGARRSILLTSPYFVPDGAIADAIVRAARRGVDVEVLTAGVASTNLDRLVRKASQAHFGRALEAGVKIYEYRPALLHAKTLVVDDQWASIGSANLDNRSFALNNELNLVFLDRRTAAVLTAHFRRDLQHAQPVSRDEWQRHRLAFLVYLPMLPLRDQL
jgi:cardiolipin synthase